MAITANRDYPIPDPANAIHPGVRDALVAIDADVSALDTDINASVDKLRTDTRARLRAASDLPVRFRARINTTTAIDPATLGDLLDRFKSTSLSLDHMDAVTSWPNDGSGSAATPPGTAPIFIANAVDGKPAVRFTNGAYLSFTARTTVRTVYVVVKHNYENLSNPIPSLAIGHGTVADWVGNQGTRVFAPAGSVGASISGGAGYFNGHQYPVELISKSPAFAVYSFVTSGNTSVSRIGSDRETWFFEGDVVEVILCSSAHNTATRQGVESYLINEYGIEMLGLLVTDGDSITADQPLFGDGLGDAQAAWCIQTALQLQEALGPIDVINCALGGQKWADLIADDTTEVHPLISADRPFVVVAAKCGVNDLLQSTPLATMQARATEYYSGVKAAGADVVIITPPDTTANDATHLAYCQWLRDTYTEFGHELADPGGDARWSDSNNAAYFNTDDVHPNSAGLAVAAEHVAPAILRALSVSEPAEVEFADPNTYNPSIWIRPGTFIGYADNDPVESPVNRSATGTVGITQSTSANRALFKTNLNNSKPGLRFDGSNDSYVVDSAEYRTIFIVAKYAPGTTFADFNGLIDLSDDRHLLNGVSGTSKLAAGTNSFLAAYKNGTELTFSSGYDFAPINTYWIGTFILPTKQTGPGTLGIITGGAGRIWNGDILELIAYPQKLSETQRKNVEGYLAFEHAISTGSPYNAVSQNGKVRLFSGPTGTSILIDGNEVITVDPDGLITLATPVAVPAGVDGDLVWDGAAWASYTPTWSNVTIGNGTVVAKFKRLGKTVIARVSFVLGSTSSISGSVRFTLPVQAAAYGGGQGMTNIGWSRMLDASVPVALDGGVIVYDTDSKATPTALDSSGAILKAVEITGTVPFTWAVSDVLTCQFTYEAA